VDKDASEAKKLLEDAKNKLLSMMQSTVDEAKDKVKSMQF